MIRVEIVPRLEVTGGRRVTAFDGSSVSFMPTVGLVPSSHRSETLLVQGETLLLRQTE